MIKILKRSTPVLSAMTSGRSLTIALLFGIAILQASGTGQRIFKAAQSTGQTNLPTPRVDPDLILSGGPPKDGIPSLDHPEFDSPNQTPFKDDDAVIGMVINGEAKAYPLNIMNWHEIVNDTIGNENVSITYCPLCHTTIAVKRKQTTFGVSGQLFQSCLVMYDHADDTHYSQPWGIGISGENVNHSLERLPTVQTTLKAWLIQYPDSKILSTRTGHQRDYDGYPYGEYFTNNNILFPVRYQDQLKYHPKAIISYVWTPDTKTPRNHFSGDSHRVVHEILRDMGSQDIELESGTIHARWDDSLSTVIVENSDGEVVPSATAFAFVYPSFYGAP